MANSVYEQLNGNNSQSQMQSNDMNGNMMDQFNSFRQNPFQFLMQRNINIPAEYQNDPHAAVNYLIQNGHMNGGALQRVMGTLQRMGFRF